MDDFTRIREMCKPTATTPAVDFDPLSPNAETIEAMKAARLGELIEVGSVDDLLDDLHAV
jgi:DNA-damage-inducible protein J